MTTLTLPFFLRCSSGLPNRSLRLLLQHRIFKLGDLNLEIPGEENVDPGVGGDDDDERQEEDLAVVQRVVDVRPVVRAVDNKLLTSAKFFSGLENLVSVVFIKLIADIPLYEKFY